MLCTLVEYRLTMCWKRTIRNHFFHTKTHKKRMKLFLVSLWKVWGIATAIDIETTKCKITIQTSKHTRLPLPCLNFNEPVSKLRRPAVMRIDEKQNGDYLCDMWISIKSYFILARVNATIYGINCEYPGDSDSRWQLPCLWFCFLDDLHHSVFRSALQKLLLNTL